MSWHDDFDADEHGAHRRARTRVTGWGIVRIAAASAGIMLGAVALVIGAIVAVNVVGTATNPGGFAAPSADGPHVALPPTTTQPESEQLEDEALAEGDAATSEEPSGLTGSQDAPMEVVDAEWIAQVAEATGIPERALSAYALAHVQIALEEPECGLDWATIAAVGGIESGHGSNGAAVLDENGSARPPIIGPALDGDGVAAIADTDGGLLDGDTTWDRAVGPMQFIPSTWEKWAADANGDGAADPNQIDDAALATARYLCASGPMTDSEGWRAAVFSYNHDNDYVDEVATIALDYAASAR